MIKTYILLILFLTIAIFSSCKKGVEAPEELKESWKLAQGAQVNQNIKKLEERINSAKDVPEKSRLYSEKATIEADKGDIDSSLASAKASVKLDPNLAEAHYALGRAHLKADSYEAAKLELLKALEYNPKHAPAHFELGNLYYKIRNYKEAIEEYKLAVQYDNKHFMAYNNLGVVYFLTNDGTKALNSLEKARDLNPKYPAVYKNLGIVNELKFKNRNAAIGYYRKYLQMSPNAPERNAVKLWISAIGG